ncbi:MAG: hypothetical protein U0270_24150 [Labilithrix sp.]
MSMRGAISRSRSRFHPTAMPMSTIESAPAYHGSWPMRSVTISIARSKKR